MSSLPIALVGLGNVGRNLIGVLRSQRDLLREHHGLEFRLVAAADSGGAAVAPGGLDLEALHAAKLRGESVGTLPGVGRPGMTGLQLAGSVECAAVLEATPVDLETGEPGLGVVRAALGRGIPVVLANKGPLALAWAELARLSDWGDPARPAMRFSACVGGALPTINVGTRDLAGARVLGVEAVLNGTTQFLLREMEAGRDYAQALAEAQRRGLAETDPSLDVDGWDAANKLVIVCNAVLRQPAVLSDVSVQGIAGVTVEDLRRAARENRRIVLLSRAERGDGGPFRLTVAPTALPLDHPLARMGADEMGVVYETDIAGRFSATSRETSPVPTAAAMLRDLIWIARDSGTALLATPRPARD